MKKLTAAKQRFLENVTLIAASRLIFSRLQESGAPLYRLSDLAETTSGGTPDRGVSNYYGGRISWLKSGELNDSFIDRTEEFITDEGLLNSSAKIYPKGTLVVALYGATVGKTGILAIDAASNQAVCAVIPRTKEITTRYLYWFFRYKRPEFLNTSFGGAQPNISQRVVRETKLPLPSIELQEQICEFLEAVERRKNGLERMDLPDLPSQLSGIHATVAHIEDLAIQIEEARKLRRRAVEETSALMGATISKMSEDLMKTNGCQLLETLTTSIGDINHEMPDSVDSGIPFISPKDFDAQGKINFDSAKKISQDDFMRLSKKCRPKSGDILLARYGTIGAARFVETDRDFLASYSISVIRPDPSKAYGKYLYWMIISPYLQKQAIAGIRGSGMADLGLKTIRRFAIPTLEKSLQKGIIEYLDTFQAKLDALKRHQAETSAELDALMPSVLDRAFRGEL